MIATTQNNSFAPIAWCQKATLHAIGSNDDQLAKNSLLNVIAKIVVLVSVIIPFICLISMLCESIKDRLVSCERNQSSQPIPPASLSEDSAGKAETFKRAPNVYINGQMQTLFLSSHPINREEKGDQLTQTPNFSGQDKLQTLYLNGHRLTQAPDMKDSPQLKILDLSGNKLTQGPNVSKNNNLQILNLSGNLLEQAIDVSQNQQLKRLNLSGNKLTTLPGSVLSLPASCIVDVRDNKFPSSFIAKFNASIAEQKRLDPSTGPTVLW